MDITDRIGAAIERLDLRVAGKLRELRGDPRRSEPAARITLLETQMRELLSSLPASVMSAALDAVAEDGTARRSFALEAVQAQLMSGYDRIGKQLLKLPAQKLGKLPAAAEGLLGESHIRLKRAAREGRAQLEQRIARHDAKLRQANEQRRETIRAAEHAHRQAEQRASRRAKAIWIGLLALATTAMLVVVVLR